MNGWAIFLLVMLSISAMSTIYHLHVGRKAYVPSEDGLTRFFVTLFSLVWYSIGLFVFLKAVEVL